MLYKMVYLKWFRVECTLSRPFSIDSNYLVQYLYYVNVPQFTDVGRILLSSKIDLVPNGFSTENYTVSNSIILCCFERKEFSTEVPFFF